MNYMKHLLILIFILICSCSKNEINRNPYLQNISFEKTINLNLPQYDDLNYNGGAVYLNSGGIKYFTSPCGLSHSLPLKLISTFTESLTL